MSECLAGHTHTPTQKQIFTMHLEKMGPLVDTLSLSLSRSRATPENKRTDGGVG